MVGADRGIGEALALAAIARGDPVLATCVEPSPALAEAGVRTVPGVDVRSDGAVAGLAARLAGRRVSLLVYVPGIVHETAFGRLDFDAMQDEYAVNALGFLRIAQVVVPFLDPGAKIGVITSRVASLGENGSGGLYGYRMSKVAANMAAVNLAHELAPRQIAVMCLHPGTVRTRLTDGLLERNTLAVAMEPADAAKGLLARLDELTIATTGTFRHANGDVLPW